MTENIVQNIMIILISILTFSSFFMLRTIQKAIQNPPTSSQLITTKTNVFTSYIEHGVFGIC